jgi:hypothetical protein
MNDELAKHELNACVLAYVKNERSSLLTMTSTLTSLVYCEVLKLLAPLGLLGAHAMSKCCKYATNDSKIYVGFTSISIKERGFELGFFGGANIRCFCVVQKKVFFGILK